LLNIFFGSPFIILMLHFFDEPIMFENNIMSHEVGQQLSDNQHDDEHSDLMGTRAKTSAANIVNVPVEGSRKPREEGVGMGVRAHTETALDNVHIYHPDQITYDLDLPTQELDGSMREHRAASPVPLDRYRQRALKAPFDNPNDEKVFYMSFKEWMVADRASLGWRSRVPPPIKDLASIEPWAKDDVHILDKVSVVRCGVTQLALDAIVNAANEECLGGGGVDGAIHSAAGDLLRRECSTFCGCRTGHTRLTKGYHLPAKFVLHTVGPIGEKPKQLASCYRSCLQLAKHHGLRTVGFCCISTGIFGYPLAAATRVALWEVFSFLKHNRDHFDRLVFACFTEHEHDVYSKLIDDVYRRVMMDEAAVTVTEEIDKKINDASV
jgi:O-acetyl-ADP-ribose deacetylase